MVSEAQQLDLEIMPCLESYCEIVPHGVDTETHDTNRKQNNYTHQQNK